MRKVLFGVMIVIAVGSLVVISQLEDPHVFTMRGSVNQIRFSMRKSESRTRLAWQPGYKKHESVSSNNTVLTELVPMKTVPNPTTNLTHGTLQSPDEPCHETSNFVFVKTHKTGSTTLRCITTRFGYTRNLSFVLGSNTIIGHLNGVSLKLKDGSYNILPPIGVKPGDYKKYKGYNISNIHLVFDGAKMESLMHGGKGIKYITILREPSQRWLSHFTYYKGYKKTGLKLEEVPQGLLPFLKNLTEKGLGSFNKQVRDIGIGDENLKKILASNGNETLMNKTLQRLDDRYSFVLITEHFDESLLVLKRLFCWDFTDILYIKQRQQPKQLILDEATTAELRHRDRVDYAVYKHFVGVLWGRVKEYGPSFQQDLETFRDLLNRTSERCLAKSVAEVSVDKYLYVENYSVSNDTFCWALVNSKFHMDIEVILRQHHKVDKRWKNLDF